MEARDIFGLESLTALGSRSGLDMRPTLLRVLTDLYVQRVTHTPAEERHYTELALRLLEAVDISTRSAVARRFARYPSPPLRVLQTLARDLPKVAAEIGAHPLLQPRTATSMPLSTRREDSAARDALIGPRPSVSPSHTIDFATASKLNEAFFAAAAQERALILRSLHIVAPLQSRPTLGARQAAVSEQLEKAALARRYKDFTQHLAGALRIPRMLAQRIADDNSGEPVLVAAKAFDISRERALPHSPVSQSRGRAFGRARARSGCVVRGHNDGVRRQHGRDLASAATRRARRGQTPAAGLGR